MRVLTHFHTLWGAQKRIPGWLKQTKSWKNWGSKRTAGADPQRDSKQQWKNTRNNPQSIKSSLILLNSRSKSSTTTAAKWRSRGEMGTCLLRLQKTLTSVWQSANNSRWYSLREPLEPVSFMIEAKYYLVRSRYWALAEKFCLDYGTKGGHLGIIPMSMWRIIGHVSGSYMPEGYNSPKFSLKWKRVNLRRALLAVLWYFGLVAFSPIFCTIPRDWKSPVFLWDEVNDIGRE